MPMPVYCVSETSDYVWCYRVAECAREGQGGGGEDQQPQVGDMYWVSLDRFDASVPDGVTPLVLRRAGDMVCYKALPEEAEAVTGLLYPAAMDRLREMVAEYERDQSIRESVAAGDFA